MDWSDTHRREHTWRRIAGLAWASEGARVW
jgi:hypothetical protein